MRSLSLPQTQEPLLEIGDGPVLKYFAKEDSISESFAATMVIYHVGCQPHTSFLNSTAICFWETKLPSLSVGGNP